jgi:hypothetical protein
MIAEARGQIEKALGELEPLFSTGSIKAADQGLRAIAPLFKLDVEDELKRRLRAAADRVAARVVELKEAESWKRWANLPKFEELIKEAEALAEVVKDVEDKRRAPALVKDLQARWKAAGAIPQDKSQALWARFKAACDLVYERSKEFFEKLDGEREENFKKKEALVARAEELSASTAWKETSDAYKRLQEEWKLIGPVPTEKGDEIWKRFRGACDKFFDARKQHDGELDTERQENLRKKEALADEAERLAGSTDFQKTANRLKAMQDEWNELGPVPREAGDGVWKKFRAACDRFFDARKAAFAEADEERAANLKKKELLCEQVEALSAAITDDHQGAMETVKKLQAEWKNVGHVPKDKSDAIWKRFRTACDKIFAGPDAPSPEDLAAAATGISGFTNRLPLEGISLASPPPSAEEDKK